MLCIWFVSLFLFGVLGLLFFCWEKDVFIFVGQFVFVGFLEGEQYIFKYILLANLFAEVI